MDTSIFRLSKRGVWRSLRLEWDERNADLAVDNVYTINAVTNIMATAAAFWPMLVCYSFYGGNDTLSVLSS